MKTTVALLKGRQQGRNYLLQAESMVMPDRLPPKATEQFDTLNDVVAHLRARAAAKSVLKTFDNQHKQLCKVLQATEAAGFKLYKAASDPEGVHRTYKAPTLMAKYPPGDETYLVWVDVSPFLTETKVALEIRAVPSRVWMTPHLVFRAGASLRGKVKAENSVLDHVLQVEPAIEELPF